ncbi:MAG: hypothetical protein QXW97_03805 [Candidatus Pacearchaeota archaeon]
MKEKIIFLFIFLIINITFCLFLINAKNYTNNSANDIKLLIYNNKEIFNGKEFEINIQATNLEEKKYDVKVFIYKENKNKPISQNFYNDKWTGSNLYMKEFFSGPEENSKYLKIRIKDDYKDFSGLAYIGVKIRESGKTKILKEITQEIKLLEYKENDDKFEIKNEDLNNQNNDNNIKVEKNKKQDIYKEILFYEDINKNKENENMTIKSKVIYLGKKDFKKLELENIKKEKNNIYESKNQKIINYSIYVFIILIIIISLFLILINLKIK